MDEGALMVLNIYSTCMHTVIASEASFLICSGRASCRKCSKCFYVYLNIRPMRYSAMQI